MRERNGRRGSFDGVHGGLTAAVGQINQHSKPVHLHHDFPAKGGEPFIIGRHTTEAYLVLVIVGELYDSHAESVIDGKHAEVPVDGGCVLEPENHSGNTLALTNPDIFCCADLPDQVRLIFQETIVVGDETHRIGKRMPGRDGAVESGDPPSLQSSQDFFVEEVTGVEAVDDDHFLMQANRFSQIHR